MRGLGGIGIAVPHGALAMVAKLDKDNGSSLTFSAVCTRNRHHCVSAFSTCTHRFVKGVRHPSISCVTNLDPMVTVRRGAAGGGPHSAINAVARVCSCLHLLFTHTNATCDCVSNRGVMGCASHRVLSLVARGCSNGTICLLTPLIRGHGNRCGRLFRTAQGGKCPGIHISNRVRRVAFNVGISHCHGRSVRTVISGVIVGTGSRGHVLRDVSLYVGVKNKAVVVLRHSSGAPHWFSHRLVSPMSNVSCTRPTPRGFSFGAPGKTYPRYGNLNAVGRVSVSGVVPSHGGAVTANKVAPLNGRAGSLVFQRVGTVNRGCNFAAGAPVTRVPRRKLGRVLGNSRRRLVVTTARLSGRDGCTVHCRKLIHCVRLRRRRNDTKRRH